jgi:hypothetical protein
MTVHEKRYIQYVNISASINFDKSVNLFDYISDEDRDEIRENGYYPLSITSS